MIKTENGITRITGNVPCLIADVTEILRAFRSGVGETQGQKKSGRFTSRLYPHGVYVRGRCNYGNAGM